MNASAHAQARSGETAITENEQSATYEPHFSNREPRPSNNDTHFVANNNELVQQPSKSGAREDFSESEMLQQQQEHCQSQQRQQSYQCSDSDH